MDSKKHILSVLIKTAVGTILFSLGFNLFLVPNGLNAGGLTGLSMVIAHLTNFDGIGVITVLLNLPLFALAGLKIGKKFFWFSLFGMIFMSVSIDVLDVRFGSLWTNIPRKLFLETGVEYGDRVSITIEHDHQTVYRNIIQYAKSFADVYVGEALAYVNSLDCVAVAINQGSFARAYNVGTGNSWRIRIEPFKGFF